MADKIIRTIGVLNSGGDAPGMNAAIRAVVRTGLGKGLKVRGIPSDSALRGDAYRRRTAEGCSDL